MSDKNAMLFFWFGLLYCLGFLFFSVKFDWVSTENLAKPLPWPFFAALPGTASMVFGLLFCDEDEVINDDK